MMDQEHIRGPNVQVPPPINPEEFALEHVGQVSTGGEVGGLYDVYTLHPGVEMPELIAEWLRYRSLSENSVAAENEADIVRFRNISQIQEHFLDDKGGRTLYLAIHPDTGTLDGIAWLRELAYDEFDFLLVEGARKGLHDEDIPANQLATIATREYSPVIRRDMARNLGVFAIDHYFAHNEQFRAIVGRYGSNDNMSKELADFSGTLSREHSIRIADNGPGWIILLATRELEEIPALDVLQDS